LFHLLVHGLGPYLPEEALPHLMAYPSLSFGPREAMPLYREWSNAIFDRVVGPLRIVFDGADQMPSDALSWQLLQAMVEALPQSVHLLMLSRQPPPIDYDHLFWGIRTWHFPFWKQKPFSVVTAVLNSPKRCCARFNRSLKGGSEE
jgi:hypothetical protein